MPTSPSVAPASTMYATGASLVMVICSDDCQDTDSLAVGVGEVLALFEPVKLLLAAEVAVLDMDRDPGPPSCEM